MRFGSGGDRNLGWDAETDGASFGGCGHAAIRRGRQTCAAGGLSEVGLPVVGLWNELLADGERPFDVYERICHAFLIRLLRSAWDVAGQDDVCARSLRVGVEGFDQRAWKLPERIDRTRRGSERR